ncbi:hypothetical protein WJX77_000175 [Trebouxia sp. C0004]
MPAEDQRDGLRVLAAAAEFEEMDASNTEAEITVGNLMRYQIHQSCTTVIVAEFEVCLQVFPEFFAAKPGDSSTAHD